MSGGGALLMLSLTVGRVVLLLWLGFDDERFAHAPDAERSGEDLNQVANAVEAVACANPRYPW